MNRIKSELNPTERYVLLKIKGYNESQVPQLIFKHEKNSTIKKAIRTLTERSIIEKVFNLSDMRQKYISITDVGKEILISHEIY